MILDAAEVSAIMNNRLCGSFDLDYYFAGFPTRNEALLKEIEGNIKASAEHGCSHVSVLITLEGEAYRDLCGYLHFIKGYDVTYDRKMNGPHVIDISWENGRQGGDIK